MTTKEMTEAEAYKSHSRTIVTSDGETIGRVSEIYIDDRTQKPDWVTVAGSHLGGTRFVPLAGASADGDTIRTRVTRRQIQDAPSVDPHRHLSEQEEARLFEHYRIPHATDGMITTQGQSDKFPAGARLRRYVAAEKLTPVIGSVRTTRWTNEG